MAIVHPDALCKLLGPVAGCRVLFLFPSLCFCFLLPFFARLVRPSGVFKVAFTSTIAAIVSNRDAPATFAVYLRPMSLFFFFRDETDRLSEAKDCAFSPIAGYSLFLESALLLFSFFFFFCGKRDRERRERKRSLPRSLLNT